MRCSTNSPELRARSERFELGGVRLGDPGVARANGHGGQQRKRQRRDPSVGHARPVPSLLLLAPPSRVSDRLVARDSSQVRSSRRTSRRSRSFAMPATCACSCSSSAATSTSCACTCLAASCCSRNMSSALLISSPRSGLVLIAGRSTAATAPRHRMPTPDRRASVRWRRRPGVRSRGRRSPGPRPGAARNR